MQDKLKFIQEVALTVGIGPLDYRMAKYVDAIGAKTADQLKEALTENKTVGRIGKTTISKLKSLLGIETEAARKSWKNEVARLTKILDEHKIAY